MCSYELFLDSMVDQSYSASASLVANEDSSYTSSANLSLSDIDSSYSSSAVLILTPACELPTIELTPTLISVDIQITGVQIPQTITLPTLININIYTKSC